MLAGIGGDLVVVANIVVLISGSERFQLHFRHGLRLVVIRSVKTHTKGPASFKERLSKPEPPICNQVTTCDYD